MYDLPINFYWGFNLSEKNLENLCQRKCFKTYLGGKDEKSRIISFTILIRKCFCICIGIEIRIGVDVVLRLGVEHGWGWDSYSELG